MSDQKNKDMSGFLMKNKKARDAKPASDQPTSRASDYSDPPPF